MNQDQLNQAIITIITIIVTNWALFFPIIKNAIKTAWDKTIEWRDMQHDIKLLKERVTSLELDVTAAHDKIRNFSKT